MLLGLSEEKIEGDKVSDTEEEERDGLRTSVGVGVGVGPGEVENLSGCVCLQQLCVYSIVCF